MTRIKIESIENCCGKVRENSCVHSTLWGVDESHSRTFQHFFVKTYSRTNFTSRSVVSNYNIFRTPKIRVRRTAKKVNMYETVTRTLFCYRQPSL